MKQFFKFLFASCLGTIVALGVIFFAFFGIAGVLSTPDSSISSDSVLMLELSDQIPEKSGNVEQSPFEYTPVNPGLHRITKLIRHAQTDDNIKGIIYKAAPYPNVGMAGASEIREALAEFRDSTDKFIYAYGDYFTNASYLLASACDSVYLNPNGMLEIKGYGAMVPFFKDMLDKIGVKMNIFYAGNYKSATEPFRRSEMSEQSKEQTREYLTDNFNLYVQEVTASRNITKSQLMEIVNSIELDNVDAAIENNIIDAKAYWYQVEDRMRDILELSEGKKINYVDLKEYDAKTTISRGSSKNRVAVIYAEGEIVYDSDEKGMISETRYHKIFDRIRRDDKVKAIVLRVNSPGGSAFSSDVIWKELETLKGDSIPLIASFGDYAASGGYYISAGADKIVSHPKTLTGSIGVFVMFPNLTELMEDKLGIGFDTVKTNPYAVSINPFFPLSDAERNALKNYTDDMYGTFLQRVAEGRNKTVEEIDEIAQGRVWTGQRAKELGLVDELGDLEDAIMIAAREAGIEDDYKVYEYPIIKKDIWEDLIYQISQMEEGESRLSRVEQELLDTYNNVRASLRYREPMARLPFVVKY